MTTDSNAQRGNLSGSQGASRNFLDANADLVRDLAGEHFHELWSSEQSVFRFLSDESASLRAAALITGCARWGLGANPLFQQWCCQLAANDHGDPQAIAINRLAEIFYGTRNRSVQRILTAIVHDKEATNEVRNNAYRTLREIEFGFEYEVVLDRQAEYPHLLKGELAPLTTIDWALLDEIDKQ